MKKIVYKVGYFTSILALLVTVSESLANADTYARIEKIQNLAMPLQDSSAKIYQVYEDFYGVNGGNIELPLSKTLVLHVMSDAREFFTQFDTAKTTLLGAVSQEKVPSCTAAMENIESKMAKDLRSKSQDKKEMATAMKNQIPVKFTVLAQAFSMQALGKSCF